MKRAGAGFDTPDAAEAIADAALQSCEPEFDAFERQSLAAHRAVYGNNADALAKSALLVEDARTTGRNGVVRAVEAYRRASRNLSH